MLDRCIWSGFKWAKAYNISRNNYYFSLFKKQEMSIAVRYIMPVFIRAFEMNYVGAWGSLF